MFCKKIQYCIRSGFRFDTDLIAQKSSTRPELIQSDNFWLCTHHIRSVELCICIINVLHICITMFSAVYHTIALSFVIRLLQDPIQINSEIDLIQTNNFWLRNRLFYRIQIWNYWPCRSSQPTIILMN